jgi:hypothetical protein
MITAKSNTLHFLDTTLMLLGSGEEPYLGFRKQVRDELVEKGLKRVLIMEEKANEEYKDITLDDKLRRIIGEFNPDLYVAIFNKDAKMDGVAFELGWLCCRYYPEGVDEKVRILSDKAFEWSETTSYIPSLFVGIPADSFDESKSHRKASTLIFKIVQYIFGRRLDDWEYPA